RDDGDAGLLRSELATEHLSDERLRQLGPEHDLDGDLVGGQIRTAVIDELLRRRRRARAEHDKGLHDLTFRRMRHSDRRSLQNRGMRVEDVVDLPRVDLEPRDDDHFLLAVDDPEVAVLVHADDVTGEEPAVPNDRGGLLGPLPVAVHDVRAAKTELPRLALAHLFCAGLDVDDPAVDVGQRNADGAGLANALARIRVRDRRRLGVTVYLKDLVAGELLEPTHHFDRDRGGTGPEPFDRAQVVLREIA